MDLPTSKPHARGRDGGVREELAAGVAPMTNDHEEPGSASCAGLGRRVHHPVGRSGGYIRACPDSLVVSRITTGRAKRLPGHPNSCVCDAKRAT